MRKVLAVSLVIGTVVAGAALAPTLAQRSFDAGIVSAEKVTSIDSTENGAWALTSSGKILFCTVGGSEQAPRVVCFDQSGPTGIDY